MLLSVERTVFAMFVASGFCGLLYQIIWMRLALASFGVITPVVSVVVSVFMLGLSLGSWLGGRWMSQRSGRPAIPAIALYGLAEMIIAAGALLVPRLFDVGARLLLPMGELASSRYLFLSAAVILVAMLPSCICMGATFPLMLAFLKQASALGAGAFSYLYLANVIGAMIGTLATSLVLIEVLGFRASLAIGAALNLTIAIASVAVMRADGARPAARAPRMPGPAERAPLAAGEAAVVGAMLFVTGFTSMALEIVWMRAFTPLLGTLVYAFAGLLAVYLLATWLGSFVYRWSVAHGQGPRVPEVVVFTSLSVLLPAVLVDPRIAPPIALAVGSIFPFCAGLGYLTPLLIDHYSAGDPARAGASYALNIIGSILGPLAAAYVLLPAVGARAAMVLLASPYLLVVAVGILRRPSAWRTRWVTASAALAVLAFLQAALVSRSYEEGALYVDAVVRRDHTATVISAGSGTDKVLLVNGREMTALTPITKVMAHLPLGLREMPARSALVICLGMGTTYRSLLSWNLEVAAVELVPSVVEAFPYYYEDAPEILANPKATTVVDDGRRFLARTARTFDLITIDPPPPVEAAGSSLLYSQQFYELARTRLAPGGILQQWFPGEERIVRQAVARSITNVFPQVRAFRSIEGWGIHFLASMQPITVPTAEEFVARMPEAARRDLLQWNEEFPILLVVENGILRREIDVRWLLDADERIAITDDRPFNEYFMLRRTLGVPGAQATAAPRD